MKKSLIILSLLIFIIIPNVKSAEIHYLLNFSVEPEQAIRVPVGDLVSFYILDTRYFLRVEKILDESNFNVGIFPYSQNVSPTFYTLRPEITLNLDADKDNKNDLKIFFLGTNIEKNYVVIGFKTDKDQSVDLINSVNQTTENNKTNITLNNEVTSEAVKETKPSMLTGIIILLALIILGVIVGYALRSK